MASGSVDGCGWGLAGLGVGRDPLSRSGGLLRARPAAEFASVGRRVRSDSRSGWLRAAPRRRVRTEHGGAARNRPPFRRGRRNETPTRTMVQEARRLSAERGVGNARWVHMRAEELPAELGLFRVITFAASFHWMNRQLVAHRVREMLDCEGVVVHVDNRHQDSLTPSSAAGRTDRGDRPFAGPVPWFRSPGRCLDPAIPPRTTKRLYSHGKPASTAPKVVVVPDGRPDLVRSIDDIVAEVFSLSATAPHLFLDRSGEFEADSPADPGCRSRRGTRTVRRPPA